MEHSQRSDIPKNKIIITATLKIILMLDSDDQFRFFIFECVVFYLINIFETLRLVDVYVCSIGILIKMK